MIVAILSFLFIAEGVKVEDSTEFITEILQNVEKGNYTGGLQI